MEVLMFWFLVFAFCSLVGMIIMFSDGEKLKGTIFLVFVLVLSAAVVLSNLKRVSDNDEERQKHSIATCDKHAECFVRTIKQVCYNTSKGSDCKDLKTTVQNLDKKVEK